MPEPPPERRFDPAADAYARARPPYPGWVADELIGRCALGSGSRILDLAAGTGELTETLAMALPGAEIHAAEPSGGMRTVLEQRLPKVEIRDGVGEALPYPDSRFSLVTIANALHWMDLEATLAEVHRVLEPGGHLAVVCQTIDPEPRLSVGLKQLVENAGVDLETFPGTTPGEPVAFGSGFGQSTSFGRPNVHNLGPGLIRDLVGYWSGVANLADEPRRMLLAEVTRIAGDGPTEMHYEITVELARSL